MNTRTDNHHLTPGLEEEATRAVARCFSGMPERMAQEPVRCGVHHLGTLWSVSGEIARAMLRFAAEQQPTTDARLRGERDYQAWCDSQPFDPEDATLEGLATCASMLEAYGPECLPANDQGQVTFERSMLGATAKCIRAFIASQEKRA